MTSHEAPPSKTGSKERVERFLAELSLQEGIVHFDQSTKTAQMAADAVGCELGQIVKSLVFVVDDQPTLALVAGDRRGDTEVIASEIGGIKAEFADPDKVRAATGYAIGGVSPFDLPVDLPVLIDDSLERFDVVYPAAGTPSSAVRLTRTQLIEISGGRVAPISQ
ncbi:MAG: YbaK/EbsC family protein [Actinomycetota bacterium]|jgi:Cys-tRNA(Pro) deacylase|nr:YbaK/EbsC family protein [Actinomycetota bacterium]